MAFENIWNPRYRALRRLTTLGRYAPTMVQLKYIEARKMMRQGVKLSRKQQEDLKARIRTRLHMKHPVTTFRMDRKKPVELVGYRYVFSGKSAWAKPVVRYKLRTRVTRYCGCRFVEWL